MLTMVWTAMKLVFRTSFRSSPHSQAERFYTSNRKKLFAETRASSEKLGTKHPDRRRAPSIRRVEHSDIGDRLLSRS